MHPELSSFAARLRGLISHEPSTFNEPQFADLALELFALQFAHNPSYRKICEARRLTPDTVQEWRQIPAVPTAGFKELDLTCLAPDERPVVFHSSGTTEQKPSRHFHCVESLAVYESSLWTWFEPNVLSASRLTPHVSHCLFLTPPPASVPHSSLVHMFDIVRQRTGQPASAFTGHLAADGSWTLDFAATLSAFESAVAAGQPLVLLGTAFSFVHLVDYLAARGLRFALPAGSRVMETGGYKNRSRILPKPELHALISAHLGLPRDAILCEYGMSELSSQAYDSVAGNTPPGAGEDVPPASRAVRHFHFPPWVRVQIIAPETGLEAAEGELGLIRLLDLANVFSVAALQTEDLGICRGAGFELVGRAQQAEPRGCSLMMG